MKAEPNCSRHAIGPILPTTRLAQVPRKMPVGVDQSRGRLSNFPMHFLPKAVQTCHDMTRPPRMMAGEFSAEKTGTVTSFRPMPMPRSILRQCQQWLVRRKVDVGLLTG